MKNQPSKRPYFPNIYSVQTIDIGGSSHTDYEVKTGGIGCLIVPKGHAEDLTVRFNDVNADKIPLKGTLRWTQPFDRIFFDWTGGADSTNIHTQIVIVTQLSGPSFDIDLFDFHDFTREEHIGGTATGSWQAIDSREIDCQEVTVQIQNNDGANTLNYRVYTTLDAGLVLWYQDINSTCSPNTSKIEKISHAVRRVRLSYQAAAATIDFNLIFWGRLT